MIECARLRRVQRRERRIARNHKIGIVAEPLETAIPDIAMDIIIRARRLPQKLNVPHRGKEETNNDDAPSYLLFKFRRNEKLAHRQEIRNAGNSQRGHEVWSAPIAEVA